jgi:hypothetical protein
MRHNTFRFILVITIITMFNFIPDRTVGQTNQESDFGISISGYVKTDLIFDSRQTINLREGHFLLYPSNENLDKNGDDINAKSSFNILSIQTRLLGKIKGPDALGAKTSGLIEGEFFGTSDGDINGFRLRQAYINLKWESSSLLIGQTWHPMFVTEVFPQVVSFNTGAPFQPFSRNPQVKFIKSLGDFNIITAIISQRDFSSNGPNGFSSSYLRNSVLPNLHMQVQYKTEKAILGIGGDYKILTPRTETSKKIKTDSKIKSFSYLAYAKMNLSPVTILIEGIYGENLADMLMLGGYAIKAIDSTTGKEEYTALKMYSIWSDISVGKDLQFGLFMAFSKNLGSNDLITGSYYTRVNNIDEIYRISPRIIWNIKLIRFALECEYTSAGYGITENNGKVINTKNVADVRILSAVYYFF